MISSLRLEKVSPGTSLGREGEGETERVLGFKMRRFGHSDDHPERITIRVDYRCSPSAAFTQDTRLSTEIQYCTGTTSVSSMNSILKLFASTGFGPATDPEYWTMVQTVRSAFQKAETEIRYGTKVQLYS